MFDFQFFTFALFHSVADLKTDAQKETRRARHSRDEKSVGISPPEKKRGNSD